MKSSFKNILTLACLALVITSCKKSFDDLYVNKNKPLSVQPSLLFNGILSGMVDAPGGQLDRTNQFQLQNNSYFGNNQYLFGSGDNLYATLTNVINMEGQALAFGARPLNPYHTLGKFFRAYLFSRMSLQMGDIPMSQALQGAAMLTPKYDVQKAVFQQSFLWLDSANTELTQLIANNDLTLAGDMYFSNNLKKWQKAVNTFRLRLLIHLSKKAGSDADLNLASQFNTIVNNPAAYPVMESTADNLQYIWLNPTNKYPLNKETFANGALNNSSATYVGLLTQLKDPRVFVTTDPAPGLVSGSVTAGDFAAFQGGDPGLDMGILASQNGGGKLSYINRWRYFSGYTGEPTPIIGYTEMCFNIAEAINRGWISAGPAGDAAAYYNLGIKSSMAFYAIPLKGTITAYSLPPGIPVTGPYVTTPVNVDYNTYYSQPAVQYAGNNANGLTQILQQKYLAFFLNSGLEPYYNWRRTGVPVFTTGVGTGNNGKIALRYKYSADDQSANTANYNAAIAQYNNVDDINGKMWLLK
ncbi:SusD-like starch-binding protein associating with outer membrane [Chitinophaga niastensis]|uniref:SusD-like starch-binding protein associating with outer membrane n=1 Tax=Chitinophaga niastensis TaxID=536980 RepID=A0A2P8HM81_CHINA|nr:SusD/RagB family nutrient-binding outer membrane lipoprotein [Chitinophaga niastensis]PSL47328.1 SusD-like starch-binding protein associating with outer membrane [Chitinophaga niastensis]